MKVAHAEREKFLARSSGIFRIGASGTIELTEYEQSHMHDLSVQPEDIRRFWTPCDENLGLTSTLLARRSFNHASNVSLRNALSSFTIPFSHFLLLVILYLVPMDK